jgi:hypothetical protein
MRRSGLSAAKRRSERPRTLAFLVAALLVLLAAGPALADLKLPPRPRGEPPLRIFRAKSADPACAPNCPEWLSVEGQIAAGSGAAFAKAVEALGGRRLPILLSSRGGSVADAALMGVLIRQKGLAVAVARTLVMGCPARDPSCPEARAVATIGGAVCASACPLILAGGVPRIAGPTAQIGVHQITTVFKETTGKAGLTTTRKIYEDRRADTAVDRYLDLMGIGEPVMALLRKTPAGGIRWLSPEEIRDSRVATATLDAAEPLLMTGANGLNARGFDGAPVGLITAWGKSADDPSVEASLAFRVGGGALALTISGAVASGWSIALGDAAPLPAQGAPTIPRAALCALGPKGRIVAKPAGGGAPAVFALADMSGRQGLFEAACP